VFALFDTMHIDPKQLEPQKLYYSILLWGALLPLFRGCFASFFSGIGKTSIVLVASSVAMGGNAIANYILIFGRFGVPAMGIRGAGYGALIGSACALVVLIIAYLRHSNREAFSISHSFRFDKEAAGKLLRYGSPTGLEMFSAMTSYSAMILIFHSCGAVVATGATIMLNWDMVAFVPLMGFEIAVTSIVGRSMGGRRPAIAERSVSSGIWLGQFYSVVILMLFLFFPMMLVKVFSPAESNSVFDQAVPLAVHMLWLASIYIMSNAIFVVLLGALRGSGDTLWTMSVALASHWAIVLVLAVFLRVMHLPALAGWGAIIAVFFIFFAIVYRRYHGGAWKKLQIVETAVPNSGPAV
jgi:multidrug resistance protein, MATE family